MRTILIAPRLKDPRVDTIVLGAWGCGAFGNDPQIMASLFAQVLQEEPLRQLYREVHFAIPPGNENAEVFDQAFSAAGLPFTRVLEGARALGAGPGDDAAEGARGDAAGARALEA